MARREADYGEQLPIGQTVMSPCCPPPLRHTISSFDEAPSSSRRARLPAPDVADEASRVARTSRRSARCGRLASLGSSRFAHDRGSRLYAEIRRDFRRRRRNRTKIHAFKMQQDLCSSSEDSGRFAFRWSLLVPSEIVDRADVARHGRSMDAT